MKWSEFYFVLKPSVFDGIGVFAAIDIEKDMRVSDPNFEVRILKKKEIPLIFHKYCIHRNEEEFFCPPRFDCMQLGWYINHSNNPNVIILRNTSASESMDPRIMSIVTCKKILAGDEILLDYNSLNEPEHLRDFFVDTGISNLT